MLGRQPDNHVGEGQEANNKGQMKIEEAEAEAPKVDAKAQTKVESGPVDADPAKSEHPPPAPAEKSSAETGDDPPPLAVKDKEAAEEYKEDTVTNEEPNAETDKATEPDRAEAESGEENPDEISLEEFLKIQV